MRLLTGQGQIEPALAQRAHHHADGGLFIFQNRALLDVALEEGAYVLAGDLITAAIADGIQCLTGGHAVAVLLGEHLMQ